MKKLNLYIVLLCIITLAILSSCDPSEDKTVAVVPKGAYAEGVIVVNEGNFSAGDGSISFYNPTTKEVQTGIFETVNNGKKLLASVQSVTLDSVTAYIILDNGDKIQIVNADTFKDEGTISDESIVTPRYMTVINHKGYLSVWGPYDESYNLINSYVLVLDLETKSIIDTIDTDEGSENSIAYNNKLYVSNSTSGNISVIDPGKTKDQIIKTIEVGTSPGALIIDNENKLWVICGGGYDDNYNALNNGALYRINTTTNEIDKTIELNMNVSTKMTINKTLDQLFFFTGKKVFTISTSATTGPTDPLITEANAVGFYGIGYDTKNDLLYVGDAKGFTSTGYVFRYRSDGTSVDNFSTGSTAPNSFIFR